MRNTADNYPYAYLLTFTTYGTWLHGDERGSVDASTAAFDSPTVSPNAARNSAMQRHMKSKPVLLDARLRQTVDTAIRHTCQIKGWRVEAINVRTNHVHVVVSGMARPERILTTLKAWATRRCREAGLLAPDTRLWTRHGSTRYLWSERHVEAAAIYVVHGQGDDLPGSRPPEPVD